MKREIKDRWVAALKSGTYQQGRGYLKQSDGYNSAFCCLGVLCDLYLQDGLDTSLWCLSEADYTDGQEVFDTPGECTETHLPRVVREWSGIRTDNAEFSMFDEELGGTITECLVDMNDTGAGFEQIAEAIEKNWRAL